MAASMQARGIAVEEQAEVGCVWHPECNCLLAATYLEQRILMLTTACRRRY